MRVPSSVTIGPIEYEITRDCDEYLARCSRVGEADHYECRIRISPHMKGQQLNETFWHELCHCIDHVTLNDSMDENAVACFSRGLFQVMKQLGIEFEENKDAN